MNPNLDSDRKSVTLRVPGNLVSTNAEALQSEINGLLATSDSTLLAWNTFVLDLTAADMVDSVGLNLIATLLKRARTRDPKLQIAYSSQNVLRILTFTRLDKYVELLKV